MRTERSLSSVVTPRRVRASGFFENGASIIMGSKKYPIDRERGHSCTTCPPEMIPGLTRIAVPNLVSYTEKEKKKKGYGTPVRDISITVPFVTFSISLSKLTS
jgi:hypothetical protein